VLDHRPATPLRLARVGAALVFAAVVATLAAACSGPAGTAAPSADASAPVTPFAASVAPPAATPSVAPSAGTAPTPVPSDGGTAGQVRTDAFGIEQVWVPAGSFTMGTDPAAIAKLTAANPPDWVASEFPSEQPPHEVQLTKGYWIDRTEVSNRAFAAFVDAGGYTNQALWSDDGRAWLAGQDAARLPLHCQGDVPDQPRMCITWFEAEAYAARRAGRLPTEAEWEYAARGPESRVYPWGPTFDRERANVLNSVAPAAVGSNPTGASWAGALDLSGNAMEWVADWLDTGYYTASPAVDPPGPATGTVKVEKGGWWGSNEFVARAAYRHYEDPPTYGDKHIGFRMASQ
jgi:formylglycine-generating enzyme required for sulfatase activity